MLPDPQAAAVVLLTYPDEKIVRTCEYISEVLQKDTERGKSLNEIRKALNRNTYSDVLIAGALQMMIEDGSVYVDSKRRNGVPGRHTTRYIYVSG